MDTLVPLTQHPRPHRLQRLDQPLGVLASGTESIHIHTSSEVRGPTWHRGWCCWRGGSRCGRWSGEAHRQGGAIGVRNTRRGEELARLFIAARARVAHVGAVVLGRASTRQRVPAVVLQTFLLFEGKRQTSRAAGGKYVHLILLLRTKYSLD